MKNEWTERLFMTIKTTFYHLKHIVEHSFSIDGSQQMMEKSLTTELFKKVLSDLLPCYHPVVGEKTSNRPHTKQSWSPIP